METLSSVFSPQTTKWLIIYRKNPNMSVQCNAIKVNKQPHVCKNALAFSVSIIRTRPSDVLIIAVSHRVRLVENVPPAYAFQYVCVCVFVCVCNHLHLVERMTWSAFNAPRDQSERYCSHRKRFACGIIRSLTDWFTIFCPSSTILLMDRIFCLCSTAFSSPLSDCFREGVCRGTHSHQSSFHVL